VTAKVPVREVAEAQAVGSAGDVLGAASEEDVRQAPADLDVTDLAPVLVGVALAGAGAGDLVVRVRVAATAGDLAAVGPGPEGLAEALDLGLDLPVPTLV